MASAGGRALINRRGFLAAASAALTGLAVGCSRGLPWKGKVNSPPAPPGGSLEPAPVQPGDSAGPLTQAPSGGEERPLFRVALLSDVHLQYPGSPLEAEVNGKFERAVADLATLKPDLWVANGDIADHGLTSEYEAFKRIMASVATPEQWLVNMGNHEHYDMEVTDQTSVGRFTEAFGLSRPYSNRVIKGVHYVMLSDEQWKSAPRKPDWCWITPEQMDWFEQVLAEHRERFTCVFMHQPLNETVASSLGENAFGGTNMAKEIDALLAVNPQVKLWFSGHTHRALTVPNQVVKKGETTFVALGSTFYLLLPPEQTGQRFKRDTGASQSRFMEFYADRVMVRARDHVAGTWMDDLALTIPVT